MTPMAAPWLSPKVVILKSSPKRVTCHNYLSVTAPCEALVTSLAYFAKTPRVYFGFGCFQAFWRFLISAAGTFKLICRLTASMVIVSPFFTIAQKAAVISFRRDMPHHKTMTAAGKTAVGNQCHVLA